MDGSLIRITESSPFRPKGRFSIWPKGRFSIWPKARFSETKLEPSPFRLRSRQARPTSG
ncbi:protein of unknown function [Micropruina glycogenica]|uniref:Uncharacterized protein n=1 Tax=Micropruina glycogenica TaxID=75385 RepID=A0A2N9JDY1_9ACTN|nr:protein of unknown function [Micropruina glycogenica]